MAEQKKIGRRTFFAGLGLATAAGVAAKLTSTPTVAAVAEATADPKGPGYHMTEHIKKYYRTTTI